MEWKWKSIESKLIKQQKLKIIVPMSGLGQRFADAGYNDIKPLIKVHGKPIIEWVINLFPGENEFIFICRNEHLKQTPLADVLNQLCPNGLVIGIDGHKFGPVYAVSKAFEHINDEEQVIVNYCDFYQDWDFEDFKKSISTRNADGSIPCYTGFHPHLLHIKNLYASCKLDENGWLTEIREKYSFETDKTKAYHSGGTYYFAKGKYVKKYFQLMMDENHHLNGEYYVSLVYNLMVRDGLRISVYDKVPHFCQWGTPQDLEEYLNWCKIIKHYRN